MTGTDHFVQFYESSDHLVGSVAEYFIHGLKVNDVCIAVATRPHLDEIERVAMSFGEDLKAARDSGRYIPLDASETLARFMVNGMPDGKLYDKVIGSLVRKSSKLGRVRAFGEMVAVLVDEGNVKAALKLEELWNKLRDKHTFSLFCAYSSDSIANSGSRDLMEHVCKAHARVIPTESYTSLRTAAERLRSVAFLQQRARQLEAELAELERRIAAKQALTPDLV